MKLGKIATIRNFQRNLRGMSYTLSSLNDHP
jgi:hypothetical protein